MLCHAISCYINNCVQIILVVVHSFEFYVNCIHSRTEDATILKLGAVDIARLQRYSMNSMEFPVFHSSPFVNSRKWDMQKSDVLHHTDLTLRISKWDPSFKQFLAVAVVIVV